MIFFNFNQRKIVLKKCAKKMTGHQGTKNFTHTSAFSINSFDPLLQKKPLNKF